MICPICRNPITESVGTHIMDFHKEYPIKQVVTANSQHWACDWVGCGRICPDIQFYVWHVQTVHFKLTVPPPLDSFSLDIKGDNARLCVAYAVKHGVNRSWFEDMLSELLGLRSKCIKLEQDAQAEVSIWRSKCGELGQDLAVLKAQPVIEAAKRREDVLARARAVNHCVEDGLDLLPLGINGTGQQDVSQSCLQGSCPVR